MKNSTVHTRFLTLYAEYKHYLAFAIRYDSLYVKFKKESKKLFFHFLITPHPAKTVDSSLLPLGTELKKSSPFQLEKVNFSELQPNSLAALSFCISAPQVQIGGKSAANQMDKTTLNNLCFTNLAGFVLISEVSAQRKVLNVMSPIPPPRAYNNWLLLGQQFVEKS